MLLLLLLLLLLVVQRRHSHRHTATSTHTHTHTPTARHGCRHTNTDKGPDFDERLLRQATPLVLCLQVFPSEGRANCLQFALHTALDSVCGREVWEPRATAVKCTLFCRPTARQPRYTNIPDSVTELGLRTETKDWRENTLNVPKTALSKVSSQLI